MATWRCEDARPWLDAYADGELEDAGRAEGLAGHVASCAHCDAEVERIRLLKRQVRTAVVAMPVPADLDMRVVGAQAGVGGWWRVAAVAAMVCVLSAGIWGVAIRPMQQQIAGIVAVGCDSHVHCTIERKSPPPAGEQAMWPLPGHHGEIIEAAATAMPAGYELLESHTCRHQGRAFTHLVFGRREAEERISVIVTRKGDREALPGWALLARMKANGIPVYEGRSGGVETAVIETPRSWAYVVSGIDAPETGLQVMARVADRIVTADRP